MTDFILFISYVVFSLYRFCAFCVLCAKSAFCISRSTFSIFFSFEFKFELEFKFIEFPQWFTSSRIFRIDAFWFDFVRFSAQFMHLALFLNAPSKLMIILIKFAIFWLYIDDWSAFRFLFVCFEFFIATFDEKLVDFSSAKSIFFEMKSIFSIDWWNSFESKFWIECSLKILISDVNVWDDSKIIEFESFISFKYDVWRLRVIDVMILSMIDSKRTSDDLDDFVFLWCIIYVYSRSTNLHRRLFISSFEWTILFNLVITT